MYIYTYMHHLLQPGDLALALRRRRRRRPLYLLFLRVGLREGAEEVSDVSLQLLHVQAGGSALHPRRRVLPRRRLARRLQLCRACPRLSEVGVCPPVSVRTSDRASVSSIHSHTHHH